MKLAVELCGTHGRPIWQSEPKYEMGNVRSDAITEEVARNLAAQLRADIENLVVDGPVLSDNRQTATIQIRSSISSAHLRTQTPRIRQIAEEVLEPLGIELPHY